MIHNIAAALFMRHENIRYTVAVKGHAFCPQLSYVLVFAEHDPILYELGDMVDHQRLYCPWLKPENIRFSFSWLDSICGPDGAKQEAERFAAAIVTDLKANGVFGERIGVDALDDVGRTALRAAGVELVDVKPAIMEARRCKTPDELACIETAIAISNNGYASFMGFKPGMFWGTLIAMFMSITDEYSQTFIPGRVFDVWDIAAACSGAVVFGWVGLMLSGWKAAVPSPATTTRRRHPDCIRPPQ